MQEASRPTALDILTRPIWFAPVLLALSAALSYMFADRNMPIADEGALLTAAVKLRHGGIFYRDVDAYAFPGVSYLLAGAMSIFGEHLSVARTLAGSFFCATVLGVYSCAIALVDPRRAALCGLSVLSLKFYAYPIYTIFFYADPSVAAGILSLALFLRHPFNGASSRLFWVGVFSGLSIVTKQSTGIYVSAVFALVLCFPAFAQGPRRRPARLAEISVFGLGLLAVVGSMSVYFASHGLFLEMIRGGLIRPFTGYLPTGGISFLPPLEWWNLGQLKAEGPTYYPQLYVELVLRTTAPIASVRNFYLTIGEIGSRILYSAIPIVFGICAWLWVRAFRAHSQDGITDSTQPDDEWKSLAQVRFFTTAGVTLAITASAFPRADFIHIITIYPAVVLILFAVSRPSLLGHGGPRSPSVPVWPQHRRFAFEAAFVLILLTTTALLSLRQDATLSHRISLERAHLWVHPRDAWLERLVRYIQEQVPAGAPFFIYGHEAHWYFLSDRYTTRSFSQLYPGMTDDETGKGLAKLIRQTHPRLIVQGVLRWPGMPAVPGYTGDFKRTLDRLYRIDANAISDPPSATMLRIWRPRD